MLFQYHYYLGIDPGYTGGIFLLDYNGNPKEYFVIPIIIHSKKGSRTVRKTDKEYKKQKTKTYTRKIKNLDLKKINNIFCYLNHKYKLIHACIELVSPRPFEGVVASFNFGGTFYSLKTFLTCYKIPYNEIRPNEWTKNIHKNIKGNSPKEKSEKYISYKFDKNIFLLPRRKKLHDGLIDAACIAEYDRLKMLNLLN